MEAPVQRTLKPPNPRCILDSTWPAQSLVHSGFDKGLRAVFVSETAMRFGRSTLWTALKGLS